MLKAIAGLLLATLALPVLFEFSARVRRRLEQGVLEASNGCATWLDLSIREPVVVVRLSEAHAVRWRLPVKWTPTNLSQPVLVREKPSLTSCREAPFQERERFTHISVAGSEPLGRPQSICIQHANDLFAGDFPCARSERGEL